MTTRLKNFIERNITLIENKHWDDLYDDADLELNNEDVYELNSILKDVLNVDSHSIARHHLINKLKKARDSFLWQLYFVDVTLDTFIRTYLNHINGLDFNEFTSIVFDFFKDDLEVQVVVDNNDVYIQKNK